MNIEELQLILNVVSDISNGAMWVALLWICKFYFSGVLWGGILIWVTKLVISFCTPLLTNSMIERELMDIFSISGYLSIRERRSLMREIRKWKEDDK